jgi:hypothetical protein
MADAPLVELVLSPRWAVRNVVIDGAPHTVLRIEHPRHGPLDFLLVGNDALELAAGLDKTAERREAAQLGGAASEVGGSADSEQTNRDTRPSFWSKIVRSKNE